jgi:peptidoglycan/LPS O-acetylase OafA/YrhL
MYHGMLLTLLVELNMKGSYYYMLMVFVISMILAYLSYKYVETPAMTLAKKKNKSRMPEKKKPEVLPAQDKLFNTDPAAPVPQPQRI